MKKLKKIVRISRWKMKYKISFIIFCCTALVLVISLIGLRNIMRAYNGVLYNILAESLSSSSDEMTLRLDSVQDLAKTISENDGIQANLMNIKDAAHVSTRDYEQIYYKLQRFCKDNQNNHIKNIGIYSDDFVMNTNASGMRVPAPAEYTTLKNRALEAEGSTVYVTDFTPKEGLYLVKEIRRINPLRLDTLGILIIQIDLNAIVSTSVSLAQYEGLQYAVADAANSLVMCDSGNLFQNGDMLSNITPKWEILKLGGVEYFATFDIIEKYDWKNVYLVPYAFVFDNITQTFWSVITVFTLGLIIILVLGGVLINNFTKHLAIVTQQMDKFAKYSPDIPVGEMDLPDTDDEIRRMYRHFNHMTKEIDELISKDYTNQILMKEAQLKTLQMQINPHFLNNTLSTVNWKAKAAGEKEISTMVESLSKLLQTTLNDDYNLISLKEELVLVDSYLTIQKIRFEERLLYSAQVPDETLEVLIPKLCLQPIIENAVTYGTEKSVNECRVFLKIWKRDNVLHIMVQNEGSAYEENIFNKLRNGEIKPRGNGIGLLNVQKRLEIAFGDEGKIELKNINEMATAHITIPFQVS